MLQSLLSMLFTLVKSILEVTLLFVCIPLVLVFALIIWLFDNIVSLFVRQIPTRAAAERVHAVLITGTFVFGMISCNYHGKLLLCCPIFKWTFMLTIWTFFFYNRCQLRHWWSACLRILTPCSCFTMQATTLHYRSQRSSSSSRQGTMRTFMRFCTSSRCFRYQHLSFKP